MSFEPAHPAKATTSMDKQYARYLSNGVADVKVSDRFTRLDDKGCPTRVKGYEIIFTSAEAASKFLNVLQSDARTEQWRIDPRKELRGPNHGKSLTLQITPPTTDRDADIISAWLQLRWGTEQVDKALEESKSNR